MVTAVSTRDKGASLGRAWVFVWAKPVIVVAQMSNAAIRNFMPIIYRGQGTLDHFPGTCPSAHCASAACRAIFIRPPHPHTQGHACWDLGWWGWMRKSFT